MNFIQKMIAYLLSVPARLKGVKFGKNSFIGPGYAIWPILRGVVLGDNVIIGKNAWFDISRYSKDAIITIGDGTSAGRNTVMAACRKISIGKKCLISYGVSFLDHEHNLFDVSASPVDGGIAKGKEIIIEDDCFIGAHSFILKGVHLGKHCVVGANSVVTKSFPGYSVIAGNPAKLIRNLKETDDEKHKENNNLGVAAI